MAEKKINNMELWEQVCETDPAITKPVKKGGYEFIAIDAQPQIKRATELWGPYGGNWGVKNLTFNYLREADVIKMVVLMADFYYPGGEFPMATDIDFRMTTRDGRVINVGDIHKKLLTDLTTKALSRLGFQSDVFEGKFDDNIYVQEMREKHSGVHTTAGANLIEQINAIIAERGVSQEHCETIQKQYPKGLHTATPANLQRILVWLEKEYPMTANVDDEMPY